MQSYPRQRKSSRKRALAKALTIALAFQLTACGKELVVVDPVAFSKVPVSLKKAPKAPKCDLAKGVDDYSTEEIKAALKCKDQAIKTTTARFNGLVRAVEKREAAIDAALSVAKK